MRRLLWSDSLSPLETLGRSEKANLHDGVQTSISKSYSSKIKSGLQAFQSGKHPLSDLKCNHTAMHKAAWVDPGLDSCYSIEGSQSCKEFEFPFQSGVKPILLAVYKISHLEWSGQRIGYVYLETVSPKMRWADRYCFTGTIFSSVGLSFRF